MQCKGVIVFLALIMLCLPVSVYDWELDKRYSGWWWWQMRSTPTLLSVQASSGDYL
jgi:hypothetical protein